MILEIKNISKHFGGLAALSDVSVQVESGIILGLIGPNGAGKTTLFNVISGFFPPSSGKVFFDGEDITNLRPDQIAKRGLVRTFQGMNLFKHKTVLENLIIAHHLQVRANFWELFFDNTRARSDEAKARENSLDILGYMGLMDFRDELAQNLPHGYQRALGVAMAMAARPRLLLLDEPITGMNPEESRKFIELIRGLRERGISVMVVEHDMKAIMGLSQRIVVLNYGRKIAEGAPQEIQKNQQVIEAYLGSEGLA
ncbi:MAG: ABC transporter ATP-binding protein [Deltaproteobacteria bacterium]|nr:ABC transporter ATP-binding protein [Deltaproteobacteria bacterium]